MMTPPLSELDHLQSPLRLICVLDKEIVLDIFEFQLF